MMHINWTNPEPGYFYLKCENGTATVEQISDNKYRWEAHKIEPVIVRLDGWIGISSSVEEAKSEAERELGLNRKSFINIEEVKKQRFNNE